MWDLSLLIAIGVYRHIFSDSTYEVLYLLQSAKDRVLKSAVSLVVNRHETLSYVRRIEL